MTIALCLNCGETKFGAICPCPNCEVSSTGDMNLDIAFSDHHISASSLERLGTVIKGIREHTDQDELVFWVFMTYISKHHSDILQAEAPEPIAAAVNDVVEKIQFPNITIEHLEQPKDDGPPQKTFPLPTDLLRSFKAATDFMIVAPIQLRNTNGEIISAMLMEEHGGVATVVCDEDLDIDEHSIGAIRSTPGCLFGWLIKPKWIERS